MTLTPRHLILACALLAITTVVAACAAPTVKLKQAKLNQITTRGLDLGVNLAVTNPNTYAMPLRKLDWNLDLFKSPFTNGAINLNNQIAAQRTTPVAINVPALFSRAAIGIQRVAQGQQIPWGFGGKCTFQTQLGPVSVQFADQGVWPNPLRGMRIPGFSDASALPPLDDAPIAPPQPLTIQIAIAPPAAP